MPPDGCGSAIFPRLATSGLRGCRLPSRPLRAGAPMRNSSLFRLAVSHSSPRFAGTVRFRLAHGAIVASYSDTGMSDPAEIDPDSVPVLPARPGLDFRQLHVALARAGYGDDAVLIELEA